MSIVVRLELQSVCEYESTEPGSSLVRGDHVPRMEGIGIWSVEQSSID